MIGYVEAYISIDTLKFHLPYSYLQGVCAISLERHKGGFWMMYCKRNERWRNRG